MHSKPSTLPTVAVAITVRILAGSTEDLSNPALRKGQRRWWIQRTDGADRPWLDIGQHPGAEPCEFTVDLVPGGRYLVGVGHATRVKFEAPSVPCTMAVDPSTGTARVSGAKPTLSVVPSTGSQGSERPAFHVKNAPIGSIARGQTYHDAATAFRDLGTMVDDGQIAADDVASGRVAVTKGAWPVASYPPPAPPVVDSAPVVSSAATVVRWEGDPDGLGFTHTTGATVRRGPSDAKRWVGRTTDGREQAFPSLNPATRFSLDQDPYPEGDSALRLETDTDTDTDRVVESLLSNEPTPTDTMRTTIEEAARVRALQNTARITEGLRHGGQPLTSKPTAPDFTWNTAEHAVSDVAVDRIRDDERYLANLGLVMPPPVVTFGGAVNQTGRDNLRLSHVEWSSEPLSVDTLDAVIANVRAEDRADFTARLGSMRMLQDGSIGVGMAGLVVPEQAALRQLVALYPRTLPRAGEVMSVLPPEVRAKVWNDGAGRDRDDDEVVVRTRTAGGDRRAAFAVVSTGYTPCDADEVARVTRDALRRVEGGGTARGEAHYNPGTTGLTVDAVWHADHVVDFAAGDIFKMGVRVESHDNGGGAVRVRLVAWRNLCFNLIITSETAATLARVVHRGNPHDMTRRLAEGIEHVMQAAGPFVRRWGHVRATPLESLLVESSGSRDLDLRAIFAEIAGGKVDPTGDLPTVRPGAIPKLADSVGDRDAFIAACLRSYAVEPNGSLADVLNAMTGLHREKVALPVLRTAEEQAGRLLTAWS